MRRRSGAAPTTAGHPCVAWASCRASSIATEKSKGPLPYAPRLGDVVLPPRCSHCGSARKEELSPALVFQVHMFRQGASEVLQGFSPVEVMQKLS